jgi:hypothetical protein
MFCFNVCYMFFNLRAIVVLRNTAILHFMMSHCFDMAVFRNEQSFIFSVQ